MNFRSEHALQQKVAKALYTMYETCIDGLVGFMYIAITLHTPDMILLSSEQECKDLYTVTIFEVKTSVGWETLGQLFRYSLYAPTYVTIPLNEAERLLKNEYTLFHALKSLGVGIATVDADKAELEIILKPGISLAIMEHELYDAIAWQIFRDLLKISPQALSRVYGAVTEFLQRELKRVVNIDKVPLLSKEDRHIIRAIINALSLQKLVLPLAENPLIVELLNPDIFKLSVDEFIKQILLSKPFNRIISFVAKVAEKDVKGIIQQCYVPVTLLLLYTKGLPLRLIGQTYDNICQRIYEDLYECYENAKLYF